MNKKANEQYKSNEKTILDVFTKLLEEKDIQKITVKEICEDAYINRSTFYNHFEDVYGVLEKMWLIHAENMRYIFRKSHTSSKRENMRLILLYIKENELFYRVSFHSPIFSKMSAGFDDVFKHHEVDSFNLKEQYKMEFIKQGMLSTIAYWLDLDCNLSIDELLDVIDTFYSLK